MLENKQNIPKIWGDDITVIEFTPELLEIKQKTEQKVKEMTNIDWKYNIALGNRYTKKNDFIAFQSDTSYMSKDKSLGEKKSIVLENGSLIFMGDNCQENYVHGMKKEDLSKLIDEETLNKYNNTRINITFRVWGLENDELLKNNQLLKTT